MNLQIGMEKILGLMQEKIYTPLTSDELMFLMQVPSEAKDEFDEALSQLIAKGKVVATKKGKLTTPDRLGLVSGVFRANSRGFGFVSTDNPTEDDIFIPPPAVNGALNKDIVLCRVMPRNPSPQGPEGEVVRVIKRGMSGIVGTFVREKGRFFVIPDDTRINSNISVSKKDSKGAVHGHKVFVKITSYPQDDEMPVGIITDILGHVNDPGVDILSIVMQREIPTDFEQAVYNESERIPEVILENELHDRHDYRNIITVTIDGEDAKDLDDAISISRLPNGNFKLCVHIADVTHYVKYNSELDKSAFKRGTSVYLTDRVIPMLPHKLCNGICSLNAGVDRLALSCEMEIDTKGVVISHDIFNSVIHVDRRMTYTIVNDILTNEESPHVDEYKDFIDIFKDMKELASILLARRVKRGAIEFDFPESKMILNDEGHPIDIVKSKRNVATNIIEEFMLICNETIAEQYFWLELPFVYRSHEEPDSEKIEKLNKFLGVLGYSLKGSTTHPKSIQNLLSKIESTPEETIISKVVLRSFKQARYTAENSGHFGLAAKYYCHFTSPIRRYPDLQIHRIIKQHLSNQLDSNLIEQYKKRLPDVSRQCSVTERNAEECEREVISLKKAQYMADRVGEEFIGVISSVTSWGIYVELPNTVEGLIRTSDLGSEKFEFDEGRMTLIGEVTKKSYKLGDTLNVIVSRVSIPERRVYFDVFA